MQQKNEKERKENFAEWNRFGHLFQRLEVPAKTVLLREGEVAGKAYYIEKGCLRLWFNHDGKDITFQFFFEGQGVASIESFRTGQPSVYSIETIEPCTVRAVSRTDLQTILESTPRLKQEIEDHTFQRLLFYQKLFLSRITNSPQERYDELVRNYPELLQRVPQHYIASYLGITPVSLSRIRNRR